MDHEKKNPYGENHPSEEGTGTPTTRDKEFRDQGGSTPDTHERTEGTGEQLDEVRERQIKSGQNSGGMGREETPDTAHEQGQYERLQDMPKHEELSDDVPS